MTLKPNDKAPHIALHNQNNDLIDSQSFLGKKIVVYFYPKDNTPGCTIEAKDFTELKSRFSEKNTIVLGISKDSVKSHANFCAKQNLDIHLLSDPDGTVCDAFGVWQEKQNYGRTYMGIVRSTFLINESGVIENVWTKVRVKGHAEAVLNHL